MNLDLLFRLTTVTPPPGRSRGRADAGEQPWRAQGAGGGMLSQGSHAPAGCRLAQTKGVVCREFLMFVDRKKVEVVNEGDWRKLPALVAGPGQLLLQTVSSVVSTGNSVSVGAWCVCVCVCARARACGCLRLLSVVSTGKAVTALHSSTVTAATVAKAGPCAARPQSTVQWLPLLPVTAETAAEPLTPTAGASAQPACLPPPRRAAGTGS